ncbi:methoxymalonate biosynthesis protein [Thermocatellispora tengchongensis]|uniref:Methoxymalonate biosynthesis protein n=1 Tax=Thermocatellispora tengchongensis TaxID=1073253 RepID=A0A840PFD3_9ACTN|nr:HAD-IIIC family phosphatase [Thermocatellispora tengchongensis]MBB5137476.1 methoxymalonate biosynthesis protein [Thermocatellispora tengchongensis]
MSEKPPLVKCLVWDLDNTLWQGTLLEDSEVRLSEEVRAVIVELDSRGILQSVASKNDHDLAWKRLEELGVAEYFLVPQIGWGRKSDSVIAIAKELQFALSTIAFVDDTPAERAEVTYHAPEVRCYTHEDVLSLVDRPEFSPAVVTADARRRREMYQANALRTVAKDSFNGPDEEFLRSLDLVMAIKRADEDDLSRVEELTLRTSQMNATGVHYPDQVLRGLLADPGHEVLTVTLTDKFGPHGAVGVLLLERHPDVWHLKLLATSCRVVTYGAGTVLLNWLVDQAAQAGVHLAADFRPTDRNRMMEIAYRFAGFTQDPCDCLSGIKSFIDGGDIQCLHLVTARREGPATMRLVSPDLTVAASI